MGRKFITLVESTLVVLSIIAFCTYFYVAFSRIAYPFSLEWIESNTFLHVLRVLQNEPIYGPPSYDFIPMIYTPFYYYVVAAFAKLTGQIMLSMRLVSILASLLVFVMIYALCRVRQIPPLVSIGAVGLFAASYAATGYWFDIGKMDILFLALLLTGYLLTVVQTKRDNTTGVLAGFVVFLSFSTKQQALLVIPFLLFHLILERRWTKTLWLGISFMVSTIVFVVTMNIITKGWFYFYVYEVPSTFSISWEMVKRYFWTLHIFPKYAWLIAAIVLLTRRNRVDIFNHLAFLFTFFLPLSVMSVVSMAHQWGWINNLLPMVAALSVIGAEAYQLVATTVNPNHNKAWIHMGLYSLVSVLMIFQFIMLRYDFRTQIPTSIAFESGYKILDILRNSKSPVFIPTSPYLLYMIDQPTHFQASSMGDLYLANQLNPDIMEISKKYQDRISEYILSKSIQTVVLPNAKWYDEVFSMENGYKCESLVTDHPPLITVTGAIRYLDRICYFDGEFSK
jgi:4-amino-4-deoxy-L-arabinose transferase-like glycosyltransferase